MHLLLALTLGLTLMLAIDPSHYPQPLTAGGGECTYCSNVNCPAGEYRAGECSATSNEYSCTGCGEGKFKVLGTPTCTAINHPLHAHPSTMHAHRLCTPIARTRIPAVVAVTMHVPPLSAS